MNFAEFAEWCLKHGIIEAEGEGHRVKFHPAALEAYHAGTSPVPDQLPPEAKDTAWEDENTDWLAVAAGRGIE